MQWAEEAKSEIANRLEEVFGNKEVRKEWRSHAENEDWLKFGEVYAPYPDIAVGPFNIHPREQGEKERKKIKEVYNQHESFFQNLLGKNVHDLRNFLKNNNPRCLLAIEIEGSRGGKHMMGNIINTSILGYIGIVVVNEKLWEDAERVKKYLDGASDFKKTKPIAKNAMVFEYNQFMDRLEKTKRSRRG